MTERNGASSKNGPEGRKIDPDQIFSIFEGDVKKHFPGVRKASEPPVKIRNDAKKQINGKN